MWRYLERALSGSDYFAHRLSFTEIRLRVESGCDKEYKEFKEYKERSQEPGRLGMAYWLLTPLLVLLELLVLPTNSSLLTDTPACWTASKC